MIKCDKGELTVNGKRQEVGAEAVELYEVNEGKILEEWKYEPMRKKLEGLKHYRKEENTGQLIDLEYQNGRLVTGQRIKAGDLICVIT